jgi:hypothetical protein
MRPAPESTLVRAALDYLAACRILASRQNTGAARARTGRLVRFGVPGDPDLRGVIPLAALREVPVGWPWGIPFYAEAKRPGQQPTRQQAARHLELTRAGALVIVFHDLAELAAALRGVGVRTPAGV